MVKIRANTVFIDLEGTITDDESLNCFISDPDLKGHSFGGILRELLVTRFGFSPKDAFTELVEVTKPCRHIDPFYFISHSDYGISEDEIWTEILEWQSKHLIIYDDAVNMIKELHKRKYKLYMLSNCARTVVYSQLNSAELAVRLNSEYFKEVYGCFDLCISKEDPVVYEKIMKIEKINPEDVVMIGNEIGIDLKSPHRAGINHSIIVDRKQSDTMKIIDKDIFVKTLDIVPELLYKF